MLKELYLVFCWIICMDNCKCLVVFEWCFKLMHTGCCFWFRIWYYLCFVCVLLGLVNDRKMYIVHTVSTAIFKFGAQKTDQFWSFPTKSGNNKTRKPTKGTHFRPNLVIFGPWKPTKLFMKSVGNEACGRTTKTDRNLCWFCGQILTRSWSAGQKPFPTDS